MTFVFIILIVVVLFFYISKKERRWIMYGTYKRSKHLVINQHKYYLEEVEFDDYQEALFKYAKIVEDIATYSDTLEVKYDLYDWSFSIFCFKDTTIEVKLLRSLKKVQLIKSSMPISIEDYEMDNPQFKLLTGII